MTDWMIVCVMEIAGLYAWDLGKEEKPLCFSMTEFCNQKCKMSRGCKMHIDACSSRTVLFKASSAFTSNEVHCHIANVAVHLAQY